MNYKTLDTRVFMPIETEIGELTSKEMQAAHLRTMMSQMARTLATKLVEDELVNIDRNYDIAKRGWHYSMAVKIWESPYDG